MNRVCGASAFRCKAPVSYIPVVVHIGGSFKDDIYIYIFNIYNIYIYIIYIIYI